MVHVRVSVQGTGDWRVNAGFDLERPFVRVGVLAPEFKPGGRAQAACGQLEHFYIGFVEVIVDPVGVTVKILDRVQRRTKSNERQDLARAVINLERIKFGEKLLRVLQQAAEKVVEVGITPKIAVEIVKVEENRSVSDLGIIRAILLQGVELLAGMILRGVLRYRAKKVGGEIAKLHDLPCVFRETKLLADFLAALRMPVGIESGRR